MLRDEFLPIGQYICAALILSKCETSVWAAGRGVYQEI